MAVMDEFRKEREAIKKAPFKEKRKYFWDYYKWYCIWGLVILIGLGSLIYDMATNKDTSLYVLFLNSMDATDDYGETFIHDFMETAGMNPKKETVLIDNSLYVDLGYSENMAQNENTLTAVQKISLFLATGDMDIMTTDSAIFDHYAYKYIFHDLREFLPEGVFEKYEPYMYYIDYAVVRAEAEAGVNAEEEIPHPTPTKPDEMEEPIPVGIYLTAIPDTFYDSYKFKEVPPILGFIRSGEHPEAALAFFQYIMEGTCQPLTTEK